MGTAQNCVQYKKLSWEEIGSLLKVDSRCCWWRMVGLDYICVCIYHSVTNIFMRPSTDDTFNDALPVVLMELCVLMPC